MEPVDLLIGNLAEAQHRTVLLTILVYGGLVFGCGWALPAILAASDTRRDARGRARLRLAVAALTTIPVCALFSWAAAAWFAGIDAVLPWPTRAVVGLNGHWVPAAAAAAALGATASGSRYAGPAVLLRATAGLAVGAIGFVAAAVWPLSKLCLII